MGFTAINNSFSPQALALFLILFVWQMPHFLAIAILYKNDYAAGGFKMLPNVNEDVTARQMVFYAMALIPVSLMPVLLGMAGAIYFAAAILLGIMFLTYAVRCAMQRTRPAARKLFFASIIYLPVLLTILVVNRI
jgi:protoheme IX farnesyltransferase